MIIGTSHFVSFAAAYQYYAEYGLAPEDVTIKIVAGEIQIGPPEIRAGQKLLKIDNGQRYAIQE